MRSAFPAPAVGMPAALRHNAAFLRSSRTCATIQNPRFREAGTKIILSPNSREPSETISVRLQKAAAGSYRKAQPLGSSKLNISA
jgi:hypothetical protein